MIERVARSVLAAAMLAALPASGAERMSEGEAEALAHEFAQCAAYYFNASNASPMREYEALYTTGERARNRAVRLMRGDRDRVGRLMAEASTEMTQMIAGDWFNFHRVRARYGDHCDALTGFDPAGEQP